MLTKGKGVAVGVSILIIFAVVGLGVFPATAMAVDVIVGQWNYSTANHWAKGPVPAGKPSKGILVITQLGDQFKMEFKSGMVFSPPELRYFTGTRNGQEYLFANSAQVDNEGGRAKNTCTLKMAGANMCKGKSYSQYTNSGITFSWGFDITLTR